jgi:hypothetical protein
MSPISCEIQGDSCLIESPEPEPNQSNSIMKLRGGMLLDFYKKGAEKLAISGRLRRKVVHLKANNLVKPLQYLDWARFAWRYSGVGYRENRYDTELTQASKRNS